MSEAGFSRSRSVCVKRRKSIFRRIAESLSSLVPSVVFSPIDLMADDVENNQNCHFVPTHGGSFNNPAYPDCPVSQPVLVDCDTNVDLDAVDRSENFSVHSSTSGVSSLLPRNSCSKFAFNVHSNAPNSASGSTYQPQSSSEPWLLSRAPASDSLIDDRPRKRQRVSTMSSQHSSSSELTSHSSFYQARTTYGGASSCHHPLLRRRAILESTVPLRFELETQNNQGNRGYLRGGTNLSSTARRILESLERFSTPLSMADRVPPPFHASGPCPAVQNTSFNEPAKSHRFPPYMHAYNRLKSVQSSGFSTVRNEDKMFHFPKETRQSSSFKVMDSLPGVSSNPLLIEKSQKNTIGFTERTTGGINFSHLPLFAGSTTETSLSNASNSLQKDSVEPPVTSVVFTFAPPLLRLPSNASRLASSSVTSASLKYTFSLPNRLGRMTNEEASGRPLVVRHASPIFDMIKDPHQTHVATSSIPYSQTSLSSHSPASRSRDNWRCEMCLLENAVTRSQCSGCSMPKFKPVQFSILSSKKITSVSKPASDDVHKGSIEKTRWECPTCMVYNDAVQTTCVCCDTKNPTITFPVAVSTESDQQQQEDAATKLHYRFNLPNINTLVSPSLISSESSNFASSSQFALGTSIISTTRTSDANTVSSSVLTTSKPLPVSDNVSMISESGTVRKCSESSKWVCPTCMVNNDTNEQCCPCCATKNPQANADDTFRTTSKSVPLFKFPVVAEKQSNTSSMLTSSPFPFSFGFPVSCTVSSTTPAISTNVSAPFPFSFPATSPASVSLSSDTTVTSSSSQRVMNSFLATSNSSSSMVPAKKSETGVNVSTEPVHLSTSTVTNPLFSFGSSTSAEKSLFSFGGTCSNSTKDPSFPGNGLVNGDLIPSLSVASFPSSFSFQAPITSVTNTNLVKPLLPFTFGLQTTVATTSPEITSAPSATSFTFTAPVSNLVQSSSAPFLFGSTPATASPSEEPVSSKQFRFGTVDAPSFGTATNTNVQSGFFNQNSTGNIFSATSTTLAPRKKIHAARRLR